MKILFIDQNFDSTNIGGAFKSNYAIINEFRKNPEFEVHILARYTKIIKTKRFSTKQINPVIKTPLKKINSLIKFLRINQYLSFFPILKEIKKFKPDVIIVQRDLTFSTILAGFLKKVPVVNVIRDAMEFCPKYIDIVNGFNNCTSILKKKQCWKCIYRWRTLKTLLEDKPKSSKSVKYHTLYYKLRYYLTKLHLYLVKYAYINIVASPLMKELVEKRTKSNRVVIKKITPIDNTSIEISKLADETILKRIESSNKTILYVLPRNEGGSKGYPFVKKLLNKLPKDNLIVIVGTLIKGLEDYSEVINISKVPTDELYYLYRKADITIVPSMYTEAFGRVIIESLVNKTPVVISPQCGANYLFLDKNYVKIIPLNVNLWLSEIRDLLEKRIKITDDEIRIIEKEFSSKECANGIIDVLKII